MPITPSASIIRGRILDAARDHLPLEHEDAEALVALLDRLIQLEAAAEECQPAPPREPEAAFDRARQALLRFQRALPGGQDAPRRIIIRLDCGVPKRAAATLRRLAKALKPKKTRKQ